MEWWQYVIGAIAFVLVLGIIVLIHEGGHFLLARKAGILCHEFAIGMGPVLFQKKIGETVYSIRLIPIGGFVSMAGEEVEFNILNGIEKIKLKFNELNEVEKLIVDVDNPAYAEDPLYDIVSSDIIGTKEALEKELFIEVKLTDSEEITRYVVNRQAIAYFPKKKMMQIAPYNRNFTNKTIWQRFLAVFAGPFMNFVLALVLFFILGVFQGYPNENTTKIANPENQTPIYIATDGEISESDEIISINGIEVSGRWSNIGNLTGQIATGTYEEDGVSKEYQGFLQVVYKNTSGEEKTVNIVPNTYIYSIEMTFKNDGFDEDGNYFLPIVGSYSQNNSKTKAYKAGLREGDLITGVKLEEEESFTEVSTIADLLKYFSAKNESVKVIFEYQRTEEDKTETQASKVIETYSNKLLETSNITKVKLEMGISPVYEFNFVKLLYKPWVETGTSVYSVFKTLGLLFTRNANVHLDDFSGPIGIFTLVTSSATQMENNSFSLSKSILSIIYLTAFLSVNIGFVNLLPLPALDGGRLAFIVYEGITKKRPSPKVENIIHSIGFILLMVLFVFISLMDVLRLIGVK